MSNDKINAVADSTKAELSVYRRRMEAKGNVAMCETHDCENEAASGSCYCDACEADWFDCDN